MKLLISTAFCLLTAFACHERAVKLTDTSSDTRKHIVYTDAKGTHYRSFGDIPDNLRTPEQKLYAKNVTDILLNGVVIENNHMILKYTKEECLAKGMTEKQYNDIQVNFRVNNHYYDSAKVKNVAEMFVDMQKDLKAHQADK